MVLKSDLDFKTAPWPSVSEQAKDCVRQLLDRNVSKRITAAQVLQHPWLTQQGLQSDKPLDNVVIQRMRQVGVFFNVLHACASQHQHHIAPPDLMLSDPTRVWWLLLWYCNQMHLRVWCSGILSMFSSELSTLAVSSNMGTDQIKCMPALYQV